MENDQNYRYEYVLVTGLTGRTGHCFIERLKQEREYVLEHFRFRAIVRNTSDTSQMDSSGIPFEKAVGDLDDEAFLTEAVKGITTLLHISGTRQSPKLVNAALATGVSRLILVHTTGIYSKYKSACQVYKDIEADISRKAKGANTTLTILRPTMIYGDIDDENMVKFIKLVDKFSLIPIVNDARYALQPVHRRDLGNAYYDVLVNPKETNNKQYTLSGEAPILLRDILSLIADYLGKKARFLSIPFFIAYPGAVVLEKLTHHHLTERVQRLVEPRAYPHDEATNDFGYVPTKFEQGLRMEVDSYMKQKEIQ